MIKIVQKKGRTKATIKGEPYDICLETVHLIVRLIERLVEVDRPFGIDVAKAVIKAMKQRLPDLQDFSETEVKEEGDKEDAASV